MHSVGDRLHTYRIARALPVTRTGGCYEATHVVLPRRALVKVAHGGSQMGVELLREVCILDALQHSGVPRVYDSDLLADKRPWFAREWLDGETAGALAARGELSAAAAIAIVRDVAEVLVYVHGRGVIHGDLHADAVLVTPKRSFGVAIIDWSDAVPHDAHAVLEPRIGRHMAPEVALGDALDDRADVFALGVLGARILTGHGAHVSPVVSDLLRQMMASDRYDRPSAAEVLAVLNDHMAVTEEIAAIEPLATDVAVGPRIRKPRWTPPMPIAAFSALLDLSDAIELMDEEELAD